MSLVQIPKKKSDDIVSTTDIANILGVTGRVVRRWCNDGLIKSTLLGGGYVIVWQDFLVFWQEYEPKLKRRRSRK